jgi:hypothetical protein
MKSGGGKIMVSELQMRQQQARKQQQELNENKRKKLLVVARALRDPLRSREVVISAMQQVRLWRERNLCSSDYIEAWEALLEQPVQAANMLEDQSQYAVQLRQNSPFVSVMRKYESVHAA